MREFFGKLVFNTVIHETVSLAEAPSAGKPVLTYAPQCRGAIEYRALAMEVTNRMTLAQKTPDAKALVKEISYAKV
jgi:chromosome partitioning protein